MSDDPCEDLVKSRDDAWKKYTRIRARTSLPAATEPLGAATPPKGGDVSEVMKAFQEYQRLRDMLDACYEENNVPPERRSQLPPDKG